MLVALAFVGGATMQAMPPTDVAHAAVPGCAEMAMSHDTDAPGSSKGMTPDCVKSMQCLGIPTSPTRMSMIEAPISYGPVAYWSIDRPLNGVSVAPLPSPPRSI